MAVHGALVAETLASDNSTPARAGYLASLRSVTLYVERLDTVAAVYNLPSLPPSLNETAGRYSPVKGMPNRKRENYEAGDNLISAESPWVDLPDEYSSESFHEFEEIRSDNEHLLYLEREQRA